MARFKTTFYDYSTGVEFTMPWPNEEQYLKGKTFLDELTSGSAIRRQPDQPDYYVLETEQQCKALLEFRKRLREAR
jgi:hypothetical protein